MQERQGEGRAWDLEPNEHAPLVSETPEAIYSRVFRVLKPRTDPPQIRLEFKPYANANSWIRLHRGVLEVRIADIFAGAPPAVLEALAFILIAKLYRREVPPVYSHRYRLYLNRREVRRKLMLLKQARGRKRFDGPAGEHVDLDSLFDELNARFFDGLLGKPELGWSRGASRTMLGHFDPSHNAIVISRLLDLPASDRLAIEYVMFHEMLHLRYPVEHTRSRRRVHTAEFRAAEKRFPNWKEAREALKRIVNA